MSEYSGWLAVAHSNAICEVILVEGDRVSRVSAGHDYSCANILGSP